MAGEAEAAAAAKTAADNAAAAAAAAAKGPSKKQLQGDLAAAWGKIAMMERQLPDLIAAKATELVDKRMAEFKPAAGDKKKDEQISTDDRVAKLEEELKARDARALAAEKRSKVASAFAGVTFVNEEAQELAVEKLLKTVEDKGGGKYVVKASRKLEATGAEVTEELSLSDAAKRYATANQWLIKGNPIGGSGAAGATGGAASAAAQAIDWDVVKYRDLKANPALMVRALSEKGQAWITEKHNKYLLKRGGGMPAGGMISYQKSPGAGPQAVAAKSGSDE